MRPKEKAKELFDKYYIICQEYTEEIQCSIQAKQCALIAVDEILKELPTEILDTYKGNVNFIDNDRLDYWQEVKQEICDL